MPVVPTLELMADMYRLDTKGGADSVRFRRYTSLCASHPIHMYNPMTSKPEAPATVDALIEIGAEEMVGQLAGDRVLSIAVLTPGAWTDRFFTDIERRIKALPFVGFWAGEPVDEVVVTAAAIHQLARLDWQDRHGPADTVARLSAQEGLALKRSEVRPVGDAERAAAAFDVVASEADMGTLISWIHGDAAGAELGYLGLGLSDGDGLAFSRRWADTLPDSAGAMLSGVTPSGA